MTHNKSINETRFKSLVENIPGAVYTCALDEHWTIEYISPMIEKLSGYPANDFVQNKIRSYASIIHPDDTDMVTKLVVDAVELHQAYKIDYRIIDKDQQIHWVYEEGRALYSENGEALWLDGVIFDVTYRKLNEKLDLGNLQVLDALSRGESLDEVLKTLVLNIENIWPGMICSVLLLDKEGRHLLNGAAPNLPDFYNEAINGVEIGPNVGSCGTAAYTGEACIIDDIETHPNWEQSVSLAQKAGLQACWSYPIFSSEKNVIGTFACYYKDTKIPNGDEIRTIQNATSIAGIAIQRHREAQAIIEAKEKAENASRAKSEFLSHMSHELRTPLNAIMGFSQLTLIGDGSASDKDYADEIYTAGEHLLSLVNDILDLSKIEQQKLDINPEQVSSDQIITECIKLVQETANSVGVSINYEPSQSDHLLIADVRRLKQILVNILTNAVKYNKDNGTVDIAVSEIDMNRTRIFISDTGHGLTEEDIDLIFMPFERLNSHHHNIDGAGIGLTIAKQLIEKMGGKIGVSSIPNTGSTFWIELPAEAEQQIA